MGKEINIKIDIINTPSMNRNTTWNMDVKIKIIISLNIDLVNEMNY